jgi:hypothetical protein
MGGTLGLGVPYPVRWDSGRRSGWPGLASDATRACLASRPGPCPGKRPSIPACSASMPAGPTSPYTGLASLYRGCNAAHSTPAPAHGTMPANVEALEVPTAKLHTEYCSKGPQGISLPQRAMPAAKPHGTTMPHVPRRVPARASLTTRPSRYPKGFGLAPVAAECAVAAPRSLAREACVAACVEACVAACVAAP